MGTRGITKVIYEGNVAVSQYGQWDHYPSGVGQDILAFLRDKENLSKLRNSIKSNLRTVSDEELDEIVKEFSDNENGLMTMEQAESFKKVYPSLSRDTGGEILKVIAEAAEEVPLVLDLEFEQDKLFCEGLYTIDLDNNMFISRYAEVYVGFDLDELPTDEEYISAFALDTASVD